MYDREFLKQQSRILRTRMPRENMIVSPGNCLYGVSDLRNYYLDLVEGDGNGIPSRIVETKQKIKEKQKEWDYRCSNSGLPKGTPPNGILAEDISRLQERLAVFELEAEEIPKLLAKAEQKRNAISVPKKRFNKPRSTFVGCGKRREDGSWRILDGRKVSEDGKRFLDDPKGESVKKYLKRVLKKRDEICKQKQKEINETVPLPLAPI